MKRADVKLFWTKSPSADVDRVELAVTIDGTEQVYNLGSEVQELMIEVDAGKSVSFRVDTFDAEGNKAQSSVATFTLGDLEAPLPATGLGYEVTAVRDVPEGGGEVPPAAPKARRDQAL